MMRYIDEGCIDPKKVHELALLLNSDRTKLYDMNIDLDGVYCIENHEGGLTLHSRTKIDLYGWKRLWEFLGERKDEVENCVTTRYRD